MVKIHKDKRGSWVKYKGRKIYLPKSLLTKASPEKEILKWLVKKVAKLRKKKQKPKTKQSKKKSIEKNQPKPIAQNKHGEPVKVTSLNEKVKQVQGETANRQLADNTATTQYIDALRHQQSLPPIVSVPRERRSEEPKPKTEAPKAPLTLPVKFPVPRTSS